MKHSKQKHRKQYDQFAALGALWPYVTGDCILAISWLFFLLVSSLTTLILPIAAKNIVIHGFGSGSARLIDQSFIVLLSLALVLALSSGARYFCVSLLSERAIARLRDKLYLHILTLDISFYEENKVGEIISRLGTDTEIVQTLIGSSISTSLRGLVTLVGAAVAMMWTSTKLAGLTAIILPIVILPIFFYGKHLTRLSRESQDCVADTSAIANETLNAIRTVKAFAREATESARYADAVKRALIAAKSRIVGQALLTGGVVALVFGGIVTVLWNGAYAVLTGTMSSGLLIQFLMYAVVAASSVGALGQIWGYVLRASGSMGRINELLSEKPSIVDPVRPVQLPKCVRGEITFENIEFQYPNHGSAALIKGFTLHVCAGETVALVGLSGVGKSTIFNLLMRFYDPQYGRILIDGLDLKLFKLAELRETFSLVPQEISIFAGSITDNILFGRPDASEFEVYSAARVAEVYGFAKEQPEGFDTLLGERGVRLSGGQRQRIAIARAVIKDAPILLLDEATSNLDAQSEASIRIALERAAHRRTTIVIAHRLSTALHADRIAVIDNGQIVAIGTHDELIRDCNVYARLAQFQLSGFGQEKQCFPSPL